MNVMLIEGPVQSIGINVRTNWPSLIVCTFTVPSCILIQFDLFNLCHRSSLSNKLSK